MALKADLWSTDQEDRVMLSTTCQGLQDPQAILLGPNEKHTMGKKRERQYSQEQRKERRQISSKQE